MLNFIPTCVHKQRSVAAASPYVKSLICLLLVVASANASANANVWQRDVQTAKGDHLDTAEPHPLGYFIRDPFLRDDGDQFCVDCTPEGKATVHNQHRFRTEVRRVGSLDGFAIFDVFYRFDDHVESGEIDWKSILVRVSPGKFREIYHLQPIAGKVVPSFFLKAGAEQILATRILIPGTGNNYYEDYFWFSPTGAVRIDIEAIDMALKSILPAGSGVWKGGGLDMRSLHYHSFVWREGDGNCCPTGGAVDIKLRLDGGRLMVTSNHFDPAAKPMD